ncbi:hypothetical protein [Jannaschia sp. M317]|uniref:hypothetical protein n=1 Tax=Jannaschia sp. M317 TaxID=2867011 RepID=UPI0021A6EF28|nr:hypothetical protein [Jannaschia sp. M317]UWQ19251.1 hypothetical protein K3551_08280 [Jannaschia sp. M317]
MSRADFETDWTPFRDALLTRFDGLTEGDLSDADGQFDALARRIAERGGQTLPDARQTLDRFLSGPMPADAFAAPQHDDAAISGSDAYIPEGEDALADDSRFGDDDLADRPMGRTG